MYLRSCVSFVKSAAGLDITHSSLSFCRGLCFCDDSLCKVTKQINIFLIAVPFIRGKWICLTLLYYIEYNSKCSLIMYKISLIER